MVNDLEKLCKALSRDLPEDLLEREVELHIEEIRESLKAGRDFILESGSQRFVISNKK